MQPSTFQPSNLLTGVLVALVLVTSTAFASRLESMAHCNQGEVARVKGEPASHHYDAAMAANPDNHLPYVSQARLALAQSDPAQAINYLTHALTNPQTNHPTHYHLGLAYLEQGQVDKAAAQFRQSDVQPSYLVHLAWRHWEQTRAQPSEDRDWTPAERYYQAAAALNPTDLELWEYLAGFYAYGPGNHEKVLATWRAAAQALPASPVPHQRLAERLWRQEHDVPGALAELEEAARLAPDDGRTYLFAADVLRRQGDLAGAEAWLQRATQAVPESGVAYFQLGQLYLGQDRTPRAVQAFRTATAVAPGVAKYHASLAKALKVMGLIDEAITEAQAAVDLEPDNQAYHRLVEALRR